MGNCLKEIGNWFDKLGSDKKERVEKICNDELGYRERKYSKKLWKEEEKRM